MKEIPLNIERELSFRKNGSEKKGKLRINRLYYDDTDEQWLCDWSLDHLYAEAVHFRGDDPLAALMRTLDFASSFIRGSVSDGIGIHWQFEGDLGGMRFPQSESDLRIRTQEGSDPETRT